MSISISILRDYRKILSKLYFMKTYLNKSAGNCRLAFKIPEVICVGLASNCRNAIVVLNSHFTAFNMAFEPSIQVRPLMKIINRLIDSGCGRKSGSKTAYECLVKHVAVDSDTAQCKEAGGYCSAEPLMSTSV